MRNHTPHIEVLETRIAPATVFAINDSNGLFSFDSATPTIVSATTPITGLVSNEIVKTIDFNPVDELLYGIAISGAGPYTARLYQIDTGTGAAILFGASPISTSLSTSAGYGMDIDPLSGFVRFVHTSGSHFAVALPSGSVSSLPAISGTNQTVALAFTNSYPGATSTTLYGIDYNSDDLVRIGGINNDPTSTGGVGTKVGDIPIVSNDSNRTGLDIVTTLEGQIGLYAISNGAKMRLYTLNLATAATEEVGIIGTGDTPVLDIAAAPAAFAFTPAKSFSYSDADGDRVVVTTNRGTLDPAQFSWVESLDGSRRELVRMQIAGDGTFSGANLSFIATKTAAGGDGRVNIGQIDAMGIDLGVVKIGGNLEKISAGTNSVTIPALKSFSALSFGSTADTAFLSISSSLSGHVPVFKIKGDFANATLLITKVGAMRIGGSIIGGDADGSGQISIGMLTTSFTLGGSIVGGDGVSSGLVWMSGGAGAVKIGGSLVGGVGVSSGIASISAASFTMGGSIIGGSNTSTGVLTLGGVSMVKIGGSIVGGSGDVSGGLSVYTAAKSVNVLGSVIGGGGATSGRVSLLGADVVRIGGSIVSGLGIYSGGAEVTTVGSFTLGGSLINGMSNVEQYLIFDTAKTVTIKGSVIGGEDNPAVVFFRGKTPPATAAESIAVGSLTIRGSVTHGEILIGGPQNNVNAAAGKIFIGGDFLASSIVAGFREGADGLYGTDDDAPAAAGTLPDIKAAIGSIVIKGRAAGSSSEGDHFGIVAEQLGSVMLGGHKLPLNAAVQDKLSFGPYADFRIIEPSIP